MTYKHDVNYLTKNKYWKLPTIQVTGLVLHSVGCSQPKPEAFFGVYNSANAPASVHGFIEPGRLVETAPMFERPGLAKKCYHVGGVWNSTRIGIEMTEPATLKYTGGATFNDTNPAKTKQFIKDVTATAAEVFADLCIFHNLEVSQISTHAEAAKTGNGSNHGDPDHIWKLINYTLADFRKDVQAQIERKKGDFLSNMTKEEFTQAMNELGAKMEAELKAEVLDTVKTAFNVHNYHKFADIPDWGKPTIEKLLKHNILAGRGEDENGEQILDLTEDVLRMAVMLDRLGLVMY